MGVDRDDLSHDELADLNARFYEAEPSAYFQIRFNNLVLFAGRGGDVGRLLHEGAEYEGVSVRIREVPDDGAEAAEAELTHQNYVAIESELLLHHLAESLLRIYLAHEGFPECPWLELSKVRGVGELHTLLGERFGESVSIEDGAARSTPVVLGREFMAPNDEAALNIEDLLRHLSDHWLRYGQIYNAGKHGFAVDSSDNMTQLGAPDEPLIETRGPAIQYLALRDGALGRRWTKGTTFVRPQRAMALIGLGVLALESMWLSVSYRYLGEGQLRPFELARSVREALGEADADGADIRTIWSIIPTVSEAERGEERTWELEVDFWGLSPGLADDPTDPL